MTAPKDRPQPASNDTALLQGQDSWQLAAIDLGSNSFHLLVASYRDERLSVVTRCGEKVQLAAGLDSRNHLDEAAIKRALTCLERFLPYLEGVARSRLRVVGTSALRTALNRQSFVTRAEALLGCRVEIISGEEEARLIYLGASQTMATNGRRLVVDIGGGSTEFIIGDPAGPLLLQSLDVGCVTHTRRHFSDGTVNEANMRRAEADVLARLEAIQANYRELGWSEALGSSGTIKAAASVLAASGGKPGVITRSGLQTLRQRLIECERLDNVTLAGLKPDRSRIFPAGVAILGAIFETFELTTMNYADGALREGVLHDMLTCAPLQQA
ncbi:Ppx/GppA family phosphatase [Halomonas daqingensis]|uniref:Ppx/GppA phosphatase family protein n=1 Tax=Billgrantia desiderata TaxID=52021 RepID=UPI0030B8121A|nr:Ppx/GppA family phosphatase [Halomonas desiderata]MCE8030223.1 Ppx/GppA family phosphatase [Halomonas desiderata]